MDNFEKIARTRLLKYLLDLAGPARAQAVKALPAPIRSQAAYKLLGTEAANVARTLPGGAGHGAKHVFDVTRQAQQFAAGMPQATRQRTVLSSLLHDVGRGAEGRMKMRLGESLFARTPSAYHSELGGRYAKSFLRRQQPYARYVPGVSRGRLSGAIRAHDTDIHRLKPWTQRLLTRDPAAGATYLADKAHGLGRVGAERTVAMAQKFKETPLQTWGVAQKNLAKYRGIIGRYATPAQARMMTPQLGEYGKQMRYYRRHGMLPKAAELKEAMPVKDFVRVLSRIGIDSNASIIRVLKKLLRFSPAGKTEIVQAVYKLPVNKRMDALNLISKLF